MPSILKEIIDSISDEEMEETRRRMHMAVKVSDAMERKGMTRKELAGIMGVSDDEAGLWLSGTFDFPDELLERLGDVLDMKR